MRRIFLYLSIFFVFFIISSSSSVLALTKTGDNNCYYCPTRANYLTIPYEEGLQTLPGGEIAPSCGYTALPIGLGSFEEIEKATSDGVCSSSQKCDDLQGCVAQDADTSCSISQTTCNSENNSQCRPKNSCTSNYCVVNVNGTEYQWTAAWPGAGQLGVCKTLSSAPQIPDPDNPPDEEVAPTNDPLSAPCRVPDDPTKETNQWSPTTGCKQIKTALGTIPTDTNTVVRWILGFVLSISGGILLLLLIINGYKLMVSQGDPEKTKDARDAIISAIAGLLLIIFSLVLIQLITVNILGIPGFGG